MKHNIVATQFPDTVEFKSTIETGKQLSVKFRHIVDVDPYNEIARKELDQAISEVRGCRTENERERKSYLKPFTEHAARINSICKSIQTPIALIEARLKSEKTRVDSYLADRRAQLLREWTAEVESVKKIGNVRYGTPLATMQKNLAWLRDLDPLSECFGELTADSSAARTVGIMSLESAIATEKDRAEVAAAKAELETMKAEIAAERAALAQAQAEVLEAAEAAQTPTDEPTLVIVPAEVPSDVPDKLIKVGERHYKQLRHDSQLLGALFDHGVESWELYDDAVESIA